MSAPSPTEIQSQGSRTAMTATTVAPTVNGTASASVGATPALMVVLAVTE